MKPPIRTLHALGAAALAFTAVVTRTNAQTAAALDIHIYAGLTITGAVGVVYSIDYVPDIAQTNDPGAWRCLEFLQLPASPYLWVDKSAPAIGQRFYRAVEFAAPTNMVFIPPGSFRIGSPTNEVDRWFWERTPTTVTINRGFWMGKYEVTQGEFQALMGTNPSFFSTNNGFSHDLSRPVERVSWYHAVGYCEATTQRERASGRITSNSLFRLPMQMEWEYACRAWTSTRFHYGDDPSYTNLKKYDWYWSNSGVTSHSVGQKPANPWGLHDMHGNIQEWCNDFLMCGGSWSADPRDCRSSYFYPGVPSGTNGSIGFRVILDPGQP